MSRFGLGDKSGDLVESLSGGMRRRLQVARALVCEPEVLILDEPTTGMDPEVRRVLWDIIGECRARGLAILLSTHYMEEAQRLCDRVAILHRGRILDCAPPQDLISRHIGEEIVEEEIRPGVRWKRPPNLEDVYLKHRMTAIGAIRCVWLRYFAVFRKSLKYAIVTTFFEPLLYLFAFGFGLGPMIGTVDVLGVQMTYRQFIFAGIVAQTVMFQAFFEAAFGAFIRMYYQRVFQAIAVTQITLSEVLWAELLWDACGRVLSS